MSTKVLLVDDEEVFVEALAQRLEIRGFKVRTAFSGDEALQKLQKEKADVVVLDVLMPGKDGIQTLCEIREAYPITEVIMLTGHGTLETGIEGMKLGAFDYLTKPTETSELVKKIENACTRKHDHEERIRNAEIDLITKTRGW
ncbi:response regulator [Thermodesulfobacteriota bacterium]